MIVTADGYILTNHHVIDGAEEIKVVLSDRRAFDAKLVGSDSPSDLAVLKISVGDLPTLALGNSGGAAANAGLKTGDVITALNGEAVNDSNELRNRVANTALFTGHSPRRFGDCSIVFGVFVS